MWSSCQADYYSSSDSEDEDQEESDEEDEDDDLDDMNHGMIKGHEGVKRISKTEMLYIMRENKWDVKTSAIELLENLTDDSLNNLTLETEKALDKKQRNLIKKLFRLKQNFLKTKVNVETFEERDHLYGGDSIFISSTQDSFVKEVRKEKDEKEDFETVKEKTEVIYKKALDDIKNNHTMRARTDEIYKLVKKEALRQKVSALKLLAYLLARESYDTKRKFSQNMMRIFREEDDQKPQVSTMQAVSIVSRGRMGRTAYNYVRRQLPKASGQN